MADGSLADEIEHRIREHTPSSVMSLLYDHADEIVEALRQDKRNARQARVFDWGCRAFGNDQMRSPQQRALRLIEEAIELAQSVFADKDQLHRLVDYVYSRPVGQVEAELGGVGVCLLAMAECVRVNADETEEREVARIMAKPIEHFTKRNQEKNDAGFKAG